MKKLTILALLISTFVGVSGAQASETCKIENTNKAMWKKENKKTYFYIYSGITDQWVLRCDDQSLLEDLAEQKILKKWTFEHKPHYVTYAIKNISFLTLASQELTARGYTQVVRDDEFEISFVKGE